MIDAGVKSSPNEILASLGVGGMLIGEPGMALDQLEPLLKITHYLSPSWLKIDPNFDLLRKSNPGETRSNCSTGNRNEGWGLGAPTLFVSAGKPHGSYCAIRNGSARKALFERPVAAVEFDRLRLAMTASRDHAPGPAIPRKSTLSS